MQVKARILSLKQNGNIKAHASIELDKAFVVKSLTLVEGKNGLFLSMPSYKSGDKYKDVCFPINKELKQKIEKEVKQAYHEALKEKQEVEEEIEEDEDLLGM